MSAVHQNGNPRVTDLERVVLAEMVRLNTPITQDDPPYPASLMPIVRAVIEAVRKHGSTVANPTEQTRQIAQLLAAHEMWPRPNRLGHLRCDCGFIVGEAGMKADVRGEIPNLHRSHVATVLLAWLESAHA
jgi:hypothetical protein